MGFDDLTRWDPLNERHAHTISLRDKRTGKRKLVRVHDDTKDEARGHVEGLRKSSPKTQKDARLLKKGERVAEGLMLGPAKDSVFDWLLEDPSTPLSEGWDWRDFGPII